MSAEASSRPGKASVSTVAIVGGGVIGAGWIGRYLHRGADVRASLRDGDLPGDPRAEARPVGASKRARHMRGPARNFL